MCTCDTDRPGFGGSLLSVALTRARKTYACVECGSAIEPGTEYYPFRYGPNYTLKDGDFKRTATTDHMCPACYRAWNDLLDAIGESRICLGQLFSCIDEQLGDGVLDDTALCVIWRQRFPTVPRGSWQDQLETESEQLALTRQGIPTHQPLLL